MNRSLIRRYENVFGERPVAFARAPGRANIIGEHTDYNDGFVLPVSIDRSVWVACGPGDGRSIRVHSDLYGIEGMNIGDGKKPAGGGWFAYIAGVVAGIRDHGIGIPSMYLLVESTVPVGAGLASSAALAVATALAILEFLEIRMDRMDVADICRDAEHDYAGIPCGIMDHYASLFGTAGHALLIDCRSREVKTIALETPFAFILLDSGEKRALVSTGYADRRRECEEALRWLGRYMADTGSFRDIDMNLLHTRKSSMPRILFRRAFHVLCENRRVLKAAAAVEAGDRAMLGRLMFQSHRSLSRCFDASTRALDALVQRAKSSPSISGARMHGGGFGGYTINLLADENSHSAQTDMGQEGIRVKTGRGAESWRI